MVNSTFTAPRTMFADFSKGLSPYFTPVEGGAITTSDSVWRKQNVSFANNKLSLVISDIAPNPPKCAYSGAEYVSKDVYRHGYYETSMRAIKQSGTVTTFFLYDRETEDEIDIEIPGSNTQEVLFNAYIRKDGRYTSLMRDNKGGGIYVPLGFDASQEFHKYGFDWQPDSITWYVDGIRRAVLTKGNSQESLTIQDGVYFVKTTHRFPDNPARIIMNAWVGKKGQWGNYSNPLPVPLSAEYQWVKYTSAD